MLARAYIDLLFEHLIGEETFTGTGWVDPEGRLYSVRKNGEFNWNNDTGHAEWALNNVSRLFKHFPEPPEDYEIVFVIMFKHGWRRVARESSGVVYVSGGPLDYRQKRALTNYAVDRHAQLVLDLGARSAVLYDPPSGDDS